MCPQCTCIHVYVLKYSLHVRSCLPYTHVHSLPPSLPPSLPDDRSCLPHSLSPPHVFLLLVLRYSDICTLHKGLLLFEIRCLPLSLPHFLMNMPPSLPPTLCEKDMPLTLPPSLTRSLMNIYMYLSMPSPSLPPSIPLPLPSGEHSSLAFTRYWRQWSVLEYCASHICGPALGVQCPHSQLIAVAGEVWYWFECALHTGWLSSTMAGAVWGGVAL